MIRLNALKNSSRGDKASRRAGRGPGSGRGKTSGRGQKGAGARSGYKRRYGKEGGQFPLYMKLPTRGFSNAQFRKEYYTINVGQLQRLVDTGVLNEGQVVNLESLRAVGLFKGAKRELKILGEGEISAKLTLEAAAASSGAREKLQKAGATLNLSEE